MISGGTLYLLLPRMGEDSFKSVGFRGFFRPFASISFSFGPSLFFPLIEELAVLLDLLCDPEHGFVKPAFLQFALPHDDDAPAFRFQLPPHLLVPLLVPAHLRCPELRVRLGNRIVLAPFVSMPEAPVDKDDRPVSRQDDVRAPRQPLVVYAIAESQAPKRITQTQLRLGGGGVDLRHDVVPLFGGEDVGHARKIVIILSKNNEFWGQYQSEDVLTRS